VFQFDQFVSLLLIKVFHNYTLNIQLVTMVLALGLKFFELKSVFVSLSL